jgi:hypothetical protein
VLNTGNVRQETFGKLFSRAVDDELYAQLLIVSVLRCRAWVGATWCSRRRSTTASTPSPWTIRRQEARGRSERMFGTLQGRLPKELTLAGVTDAEAANRFIAEVYLPEHNARFARPPAVAESAFVAAVPANSPRPCASRSSGWSPATTPSPMTD